MVVDSNLSSCVKLRYFNGDKNQLYAEPCTSAMSVVICQKQC
jgi:hypothetical protein